MIIMTYQRQFILQSCHFNGASEYAAFQQAQALWNSDPYKAYALLRQAARNTHGHNFAVQITVRADPEFSFKDWLVDDIALEEVVREFDNQNLSLHPAFEKMRATTENLAELLAGRIAAILPRAMRVSVDVQETRDIHAVSNVRSGEKE